jgi:hypothetical protein
MKTKNNSLNLLVLIFGLAFLATLSSCASMVGIARLPSSDKLIISTASEDAFVAQKTLVVPYQPLGFVEYRGSRFSPFGWGNIPQYASLESVIQKEVVENATRKLSADGLINTKFKIVSSFKEYERVFYTGPIRDFFNIPLIGWALSPINWIFTGFAMLFNVNVVSLEAIAV